MTEVSVQQLHDS